MRSLQVELAEQSARVQKWMRRAVAAERTVLRSHPDVDERPARAVPAAPPLGLSPVKLRRWMRDHGSPPLEVGAANGGGPDQEE